MGSATIGNSPSDNPFTIASEAEEQKSHRKNQSNTSQIINDSGNNQSSGLRRSNTKNDSELMSLK
jgi:hypothetical protein